MAARETSDGRLQQFTQTRHGISIVYWSLVVLVALLVLERVLPQFVSAGYQQVNPILNGLRTSSVWFYPALEFTLVLGIAWVILAWIPSKATRWGIACLVFTILAFLWPTIVYSIGLSTKWLLGYGIGFPALIPMIQAWMFVCLLNDLSSETFEKVLNDPNHSEKDSLSVKQSLSSATSTLTFLKWIGVGCLAVWIVLYLLPNFGTFFALQSPVAFRLWILLPQIGVFLMMILLAVFSRPVTKLIGSLKGLGDDSSSGSHLLSSQDAEPQGDAMRPIVWALLGLVLASLVSQAVAQRWLAPKYLEKQIASSKTTIEDMKSRPQNGSQVPTPSGPPSISIKNQQGLFEQVVKRYYSECLSIFPMLAVYTVGVVLSLLHLRRLGKPARFALAGCVMFWLITILNPAIQEYYLSQWRASGTNVKQLSSFSSPYNLGRVSFQCIAFSFMLAAVFYKPAARIENQTNPIGEL